MWLSTVPAPIASGLHWDVLCSSPVGRKWPARRHSCRLSALSLVPEEAVSPLPLLSPLPQLCLQSEWHAGEQGAREQLLFGSVCAGSSSSRLWPAGAGLQRQSHHQGLKPDQHPQRHWVLGPHKSLFHMVPGLPQAPWLKSDKGPLC